MLLLRCIVGAALGFFGGSIVGLVGGVVLGFPLTALSGGNEQMAVNTVGLAMLFTIPVGLIVGIMIPIRSASKRRQAAKVEEEARVLRQEAEEEARLRRQEAKEADRVRRHKEEQWGYRDQMITLGEKSMIIFESMPTHLRAAEQYLDQAEIDFADDAFAPFGDSIENAAKTLGRFDEGVCGITNNSSRYTELIKKYENTPPIFPLAPQSVSKLGVGTATAERMKAIVRTAQRNFQFAVIYEQRKTNQILVAGFTNLAQALDRMTWRITSSINDLAGSVDIMTSTLNDSMHAIHSRVDDIAQSSAQRHREASKEASERVAREKKVLDMLDNIQRGRKPLL